MFKLVSMTWFFPFDSFDSVDDDDVDDEEEEEEEFEYRDLEYWLVCLSDRG